MARIRPLARTDEVVTEDVDDEVIVYDERTDVACRLNRTAALVWRKCDGKHTVEDLVRVLDADLGDIADEDLVLVTLDYLSEQRLLESGYARRDEASSQLSRRTPARMEVGVGSTTRPAPSRSIRPARANWSAPWGKKSIGTPASRDSCTELLPL